MCIIAKYSGVCMTHVHTYVRTDWCIVTGIQEMRMVQKTKKFILFMAAFQGFVFMTLSASDLGDVSIL